MPAGHDMSDITVTLQGQFLIAMPSMGDSRFQQSVIYVCAHSEEGAMGLVVNRPADHITFDELLDQLSIDAPSPARVPVHLGGPVETGRGFVLHSPDYAGTGSTIGVGEGVDLTATVDVLRAMATGAGPARSLLVLGYAGWGPGQLEAEIIANGWLTSEGDPALIFEADADEKWTRALAALGVDPTGLSGEAGHA